MLGKIRTALACTFMLSLAVQSGVPVRGSTNTYLDPRFAQVRSSTVSAIVTGDRAADAVKRVGGTVTSDLWVIDAVSATIPTTSARLLAASTGIESVVLNDIVKTADAGSARGTRVTKNQQLLPGKQLAPTRVLPDGGFVTVTERGIVTLFTPDGTSNAIVTLPNSLYNVAPLVLDDGTIVVSSESRNMYAISAQGKVLWHLNLGNDAKLFGGVVEGPADLLYAVNENGVVYAIARTTGQIQWSHAAPISGLVRAAPVVGPDGNAYVATDGGQVYAVSASGVRLWSVSVGTKFTLSPLLGLNNSLILTSSENTRVTALASDTGAMLWSFATIGKILALPAIDRNGRAYVGTEDGYVYALDVNGAQRWRMRAPSGKFTSSPVLSRDERTLYVAQYEDPVFAFDTATGMERWRFAMSGNINGAPTLDADDGIVVGSDTQDLVRIDAQGRVTYRSVAAGQITQAAVTNDRGDTMIRLNDSSMMAIGRLPEVWDGRPDVQATSNPTAWKVVNPATVDVGADIVHQVTTAGGKQIRGSGVTVAVVDSGIYFDKFVRANQGSMLTRLFKGQADFVDPRCFNVGLILPSLCFAALADSVDPFGHGTAVSSIVWNNYTDSNTKSALGIAPDANILSVRVLDGDGAGSYENVIKGIQYVVQNRLLHNIRVMNLSMSSVGDVPYFVDPINRAVERAWASGIVVVAAAGNSGANAETITAPGNDPYIITVGAINTRRTPGYWADDTLPSWSATGPTRDGFVKPDVLASGTNVVTFMYKDPTNPARSQKIVQMHPDNSLTSSLFRMNGTSMSSPIVAGIAALMIQANPTITPDQVKYRLLTNARLSVTPNGDALTYNAFQQGAGRVWAPDAVLGTATGNGNAGMNVVHDLAAGFATATQLSAHYQGPTQKILSDDGKVWLYYAKKLDGSDIWLGFADAATMAWLNTNEVALASTTWDAGRMRWGTNMVWEGGSSTDTANASEGAGRMSWGSGRMSWGSGRMSWGSGRMSWGSGRMSWGSGRMSWGSSTNLDEPVSSTSWVFDADY